VTRTCAGPRSGQPIHIEFKQVNLREKVTAAVDALWRRHEPPAPELAARFPGSLRRGLYVALRTATSPAEVEALRPLARALDERFGGVTLGNRVDRPARLDFRRRPTLAALFLLSFVFHWNDFLEPLIYLPDRDTMTLAVGLRTMLGLYQTNWNYLMAAATLMTVPIVVIFFLAQRYFIRGIVTSGLTGR